MKKAIAVLLVLTVGIAAFLYFPRATVAEAVNNAVLAVLDHGVFAQRTGAAEGPALDGDIFATGDLVRADADGRAVLTFFEGSTISVEPNSHVRVVSLVKTGSGGIQLTVEQTLGRTWASVSDLVSPDSKFEIRTPSMTAIVRGTAFETIVEKQADGTTTTTVKTGEGEVLVLAKAGGDVTVRAKEQVAVNENERAPARAEPQPPTPKLRVAAPAGVGFVVIDPRGLRCGATGTASERQIPRCDVSRDGGQTVVIGDVVPGDYQLVMTAAQSLSNATIVAEGLGVAGTDFTHRFSSPLAVGDLLRVTIPLTLAGKLGSAGFSRPELVTSVCGAEATGRVFSGGKVEERLTLLRQFSFDSKGQPAAFVVTGAEMTAAVQQALDTNSASIPVTVSGLAVVLDPAGLHLSATIAAGPLTVPARADLIGGALDGRLHLKLRQLDAGIVPDAAKQQIATAIEQAFADLTEDFPLVVKRVAFRSGCMAVIGRTPN